MLIRQKIKLAILVCVLLGFGIVSGLLIHRDHQYCMSVRLITENALGNYTEDPSMDISCLRFNGEKIALDRESSTLYISQPSDTFSHSSELVGILESADPDTSLYFIRTPAITDISEAVSNGSALSLILVNNGTFRKVNVIITSLPVLRLEQTTAHWDEAGQEILTGHFLLSGSASSSATDYSLVSGTTQWHIRGQTTTLLSKKSWKLSLKDESGENSNQDLLGLGADDDWILNAMARDDTKLRDKLASDLWNQQLSGTESNYPMSRTQYVEVIINDSYQGLYLLMRRVDAKYLQLDPQKDILLKGMNTWTPEAATDAYEIISSPYPFEETYSILESTLANSNAFNEENFIKTNLLLNYCSAPDNVGYKNMFYILHWESGAYILYFVPWDMDMTMGAAYMDGFVYDYELSLSQYTYRMEYAQVKKSYPQLNQNMSANWKKLRMTVYSEVNLNQLLSDHIYSICSSGAYARDTNKWGCVYGGEDTHSALYQWCMERLSVLDTFYSK